MYVQPHDVAHEFPEFISLIAQLKEQDHKLAQLIEDYEKVNAEIVNIEENDKPFQDFEFENMKKLRLKLKDEIYLILIGHRH